MTQTAVAARSFGIATRTPAMLPSSLRPAPTDVGLLAGCLIRALAVARGQRSAATAYLEADPTAHAAAARAMLRAAVGQTLPEDVGLAMSGAGRDLAALTRTGGRSMLAALQALGARRVPPRCALIEQGAGAAAAFASPGEALPVSAGSYDREGLTPRRVGALVVQADALLRADPLVADVILAADLADALALAIDTALLDVAAMPTDASPGGLAYASPTFPAAGSATADIDAGLAALQRSLTESGHGLGRTIWAMHASTFAALQQRRDSSGAHAWPTLHEPQPTLLGRPVLATPAVPRHGSPGTSSIALIDAASVRYTDDDRLAIDVSRQAALQMDSAPAGSAADDTGTPMTSLFQVDCFAVRGVRFVAWRLGRASAAATLVGVEL